MNDEKEIPVNVDAELDKLAKEHFVKKHLKKHKREIARLKKEAELALFTNNFDKYEYAICKLRRIYFQPYTKELIEMQFKTSREAVLDIVKKQLDGE